MAGLIFRSDVTGDICATDKCEAGRFKRGARAGRGRGQRALALASCVSFRAFEEEAECTRRASVVCCPETFGAEEVAARIQSNRENEKQRWIFELIAGRFAPNETLFIDEAEWLMVEGTSWVGQTSRYLVIFKDLTLHTVRDLRQRHVGMLREVQGAVRAFLTTRHAPSAAKEFRLYFHYLPSVFQLHLHVCAGVPMDIDRRQYLSGVIRNLEADDMWFRDALMLCSEARRARIGFVQCGRGHKRSPIHI